MKLNRLQLRQIIMEATYFPPNVGKEDIEHLNMMRSVLSPEQKEKADTLVDHEPTNLSGYMLGGAPKEVPDLPTEDIPLDHGLDLANSYYGQQGGMKEIVMAIDDDLFSYVMTHGTESMVPDGYAGGDMEKVYSLPIEQVYRSFRKQNVDKALIDQIIEHYSYYGFERYFVNIGGRQVEYLRVKDQ